MNAARKQAECIRSVCICPREHSEDSIRRRAAPQPPPTPHPAPCTPPLPLPAQGFSPHNLHFFWVARLTDLTTFKWLLLMLPEPSPSSPSDPSEPRNFVAEIVVGQKYRER